MMKIRISILLIYVLHAAARVCAQSDVFNPEPDFIFDAKSSIATGLGVADINQDGWDDIVVANGCDIRKQQVCVYYNNGNGTFPASPSWISSDIDFNCHVAVGDINGDNLPDVAVSVIFAGRDWYELTFEPGYVKIYFNQGYALEPIPSYYTADSVFTFSCALGDADGDGDLDLAVAGGLEFDIPGIPHQTHGRIYYNDGSNLQTLPGWQSEDEMASSDVEFADMDNNGFLDVLFANMDESHCIFLADSCGQIQSRPGWTSSDTQYMGNSLIISKLDTNNFPDVIISGEGSSHGICKAYIFESKPAGQSLPGWYGKVSGVGSGIIADDFNNDGHCDLAVGTWYGKIRLYPGIQNSLGPDPVWLSDTYSIIEAFALRDIDQDHYFIVTDTINIPLDSMHAVYLSKMNVERIISVTLNGQRIEPGIDYCTVPGAQWISTRPALQNGDNLIITYFSSNDRDLVVTNFDSDIGNYIFYNQTYPVTSVEPEIKEPEFRVEAFPNPFNVSTTIRFIVIKPGFVTLKVYDLRGRVIETLVKEYRDSGVYMMLWNVQDTPSGNYLCRLETKEYSETKKLIVQK